MLSKVQQFAISIQTLPEVSPIFWPYKNVDLPYEHTKNMWKTMENQWENSMNMMYKCSIFYIYVGLQEGNKPKIVVFGGM